MPAGEHSLGNRIAYFKKTGGQFRCNSGETHIVPQSSHRLSSHRLDCRARRG